MGIKYAACSQVNVAIEFEYNLVFLMLELKVISNYLIYLCT